MTSQTEPKITQCPCLVCPSANHLNDQTCLEVDCLKFQNWQKVVDPDPEDADQ